MSLVAFRVFVAASVLGVLVSCSSGYRAPVEDRKQRSKSAAPSVYHVQRGETLYSISWRYGLDHRSVALANGIPSPFTIYPGQKSYFTKKAATAKTRTAKPASTKSKAPSASKSGSTASSKTVPVASTPLPAKSSSAPATKISKWRWPTKGKVVRGYSSTVHKGVDISGKSGDAIYAVAAGKVVYAGTGIVGYGEMLIVKHSEIYLSAYGHNSRLLVREGAQVKAGQKIAEKGNSGTDTVKLHFEIRKEGKPVDPQKLLP